MIRYETAVQAEWVDYNGHMRDAYYGLVFSYAIDGFMDGIGMDAGYRKATGGTLYVVEDHRRYLLELKEGGAIAVATGLAGHDEKRLHLWQTLESDGRICATCESVALHVTQSDEAAHVSAMAAAVLDRLPEHLLPDAAVRLSLTRERADA